MKNLVITFILFACGFSLMAQEDSTKTVLKVIVPDSVFQGQLFRLTYEINSEVNGFSPPDEWGDWVLTSSLTTGSLVSIVNGKKSHKMSYSYNLYTQKTGKIAIPSVIIIARGKRYVSEPVTVKVIPVEEKSSSATADISAEDLFLETTVENKSPKAGEKARLTCKLYTTVNIIQLNSFEFPDISYCYVREAEKSSSARSEKVNRNGKDYQVATVWQGEITPLQTGEITIGKAGCELVCISKENKGMSGSYSENMPMTKLLETSPITLKVQKGTLFNAVVPSYAAPTPDNAPDRKTLFFVLDVSSSMLSAGKLEMSCEFARQYMDAYPERNAGLAVFAGESAVLSPVTNNLEKLKNLLKSLPVREMTPGTNVSAGLLSAIDRLRDQGAIFKEIILLTDAFADNGKLSPFTAAEVAKSFGLKVHVIGVAANEGISDIDLPADNVSIDETVLKQIAAITGGKYFRATDDASLQEIVSRIEADSSSEKMPTNQSHYPKNRMTRSAVDWLLEENRKDELQIRLRAPEIKLPADAISI